MARQSKATKRIVLLALLALLLYLLLRKRGGLTEQVSHTIGFDSGQLTGAASGTSELGCTEYTLPDITLPGSVSIPGGTRRVCFGG